MEATRCLDDFDPDFKYKFSNDSHSWLINFPDSLKPDPNALKISSTNETYAEHEIRRQTTKGKRKKLMEDFYRKVISEEILSNLGEDNIIIEEYATDYMEKFKNPDDMPLPGETLSKNEKLKKENNPESCSNESSNKFKLEEIPPDGDQCTERRYRCCLSVVNSILNLKLKNSESMPLTLKVTFQNSKVNKIV